MSKNKEKAEPTLDYQQLAEHMLGSWQDQWRQFATAKDNPFAANNDWLSTWSNAAAAMTGAWAAPTPPTQQAETGAAKKPQDKQEETSHHAAASQPQQPAPAHTNNAGTAAPVSAPTAAASSARDVLLTELARRVEFLHERVVALESELDKLKCSGKQQG